MKDSKLFKIQIGLFAVLKNNSKDLTRRASSLQTNIAKKRVSVVN